MKFDDFEFEYRLIGGASHGALIAVVDWLITDKVKRDGWDSIPHELRRHIEARSTMEEWA